MSICKLSTFDRHIPTVVARDGILFIAGFVFFVHHHQFKIIDRRENCRPRPDDHIGLSAFDVSPLGISLGAGQLRMQNCQVLKPAAEPLNRLCRQGDFRQQDNRSFGRRDTGRNRTNIDFRFTAVGNTMQNGYTKAVFIDLIRYKIQRLLLIVIEYHIFRLRRQTLRHHGQRVQHLLFRNLDDLLTHKLFERTFSTVGGF